MFEIFRKNFIKGLAENYRPRVEFPEDLKQRSKIGIFWESEEHFVVTE